MEYKSFLYDVSDKGIATVTLNRPEKMNALTFETYFELGELAHNLREDDSVRALIITGTGRGFCAGGDKNKINFAEKVNTGDLLKEIHHLDRLPKTD